MPDQVNQTDNNVNLVYKNNDFYPINLFIQFMRSELYQYPGPHAPHRCIRVIKVGKPPYQVEP
jgi:hypothetical protein